MGGDRGEERSKISDDLSWRISRSTDEEVDGDAHSPEGERSVVTLAADLQEAAAALAVGRRVAEALQAQAAVAAAAAAAARETQSELEVPSTCIIVSSGSPLVLPLPLTLYSTPSRLGMCSALGSTWARAPGGGCAPPVVAPSSDGRTCGQIGQDRLGGFGVVIFLTHISAFRVYPATRLYYTAPLQCCTCTGSARTMDSSASESSI